MEEKLITYLYSIDKVDTKLLHLLTDIFGKEIVDECFLKCMKKMDSQDGEFYEKQLQIWEKFGYYLASLERNPFEEYVLKQFQKVSKSPVKKTYYDSEEEIPRDPLFTLEEEVQYGFHLLSRSYIQLFLTEGDDLTLDVLKIFSSIQTVEGRNLVLEKFKKFYQQCSRKSNFDEHLQKFLFAYQKECLDTPLPDIQKLSDYFDDSWYQGTIEVMEQREMIEQLEMYFRYSIAKNLFSICNFRLVEFISFKYNYTNISGANNIIEREEIVQDGIFGLMRAIQTFDIRKCYKFSTYANHWIPLSMNRMLENSVNTIRIPVYMQFLRVKIENVRRVFYQENGKQPTEEELATFVNIPVKQLRTILSNQFQFSCESLNRFARVNDRDSDCQLWEIIEDKQDEDNVSFEEQYAFQSLFQGCMDFIDSRLNNREKDVLFKRSGYLNDHPMTLEEIGQEFGCSRENVRLIEAKALKKLRRISHFEEYNPFK